MTGIASAQESLRVSPTTLSPGEESFLTIFVPNVAFGESVKITFAGPAGQFERGVSSWGDGFIITYVPDPVMSAEGRYSVSLTVLRGELIQNLGTGFFNVEIPQDVVIPLFILVPEWVIVEATSIQGAKVDYTVSSTDGTPVTCNPASGSTFPLGGSSVLCTATRGQETVTERFSVMVADTLPPSIVVPGPIVSDNPVVNFTVTATDALDATPTIICNPPSGSTFPGGVTRVNCLTFDHHLNYAFGSFTVTVTGGPPALILPDNISTEATGPAGAVVEYVVSATEDGVVTCAPVSGSTFALGETTVNCSATNNKGTTNGSFTVFVDDYTAPVLFLPDDITVEKTSASGAVVEFVASASDIVSGSLPVTCQPPSGSTFPIGDTLVECRAVDGRGNFELGSFVVTVTNNPPPVLTVPDDITREATGPAGRTVTFNATATNDGVVECTPASGSLFALGTTTVNCTATNTGGTDTDSFTVKIVDTTPPALVVPGDITAEATSPDGAAVTFVATATDIVDGNVGVTCVPASGSTFALGTTLVKCSASDTRDNTAHGSFNVSVVDTTAPALVVPADITAEATSPDGAAVTYVATATDIVDGNVAVTCVPASGSTFALGTTLVQCSASDTRNNTAHDSFNVNVVDTTAPVIVSVKPSLSALWPPNHKMEPITLSVVATDAADLSPTSIIIDVSSNQPVNGTGDGDKAPDWTITGPLTLELRSERAGTQDRIYTITVQTTDDSGNSSTDTTTVRVTQSRRR